MIDLPDRLRAELVHDISDDVRARHLAGARAVRAAVDTEPAPRATTSASRLRRRFAAGSVAFGLIAVPTVAAAQTALPGEALHGLKTALEPIQALFDADVREEHRLQELEALLEDDESSSASLLGAVERAQEALEDAEASDVAHQRLDDLREQAEERLASDLPGEGVGLPPDEAPTEQPTEEPSQRGNRPEDPGPPEESGNPTDHGRPSETSTADEDADQGEGEDEDEADGEFGKRPSVDGEPSERAQAPNPHN